jgi:ribulose-phosphate 3-epimerase
MSVHPGFSGQSFIESVLDKASAISERLRPDQRLEIDGGVNLSNAGRALEAGCDVLAAASAIFKEPRARRASVIETLRGPKGVARKDGSGRAHNGSEQKEALR